MDWRVYFATFIAVFFAELADKTQLVGIGVASRSGKPLSVWLGSVSAYIIITAVSVMVGAKMSRFINPEFIRYPAGILFVIIGALIFWGKI